MKQLLITTTNGTSTYAWQDGGFLTFEEYALATITGVLSAGIAILGIEVL